MGIRRLLMDQNLKLRICDRFLHILLKKAFVFQKGIAAEAQADEADLFTPCDELIAPHFEIRDGLIKYADRGSRDAMLGERVDPQKILRIGQAAPTHDFPAVLMSKIMDGNVYIPLC